MKRKKKRAEKAVRIYPASFEKLRRLAFKLHIPLAKAFEVALNEALNNSFTTPPAPSAPDYSSAGYDAGS